MVCLQNVSDETFANYIVYIVYYVTWITRCCCFAKVMVIWEDILV